MAPRGDDQFDDSEAGRAGKGASEASTVETSSDASQELAFAATLAHAEAGTGNVDLVGRRLAHFRIVSRLGAGGMGVVYRAEDETLHRPVALKIVSFARGRAEQKEHLLREARSAAAVSHASIAAIYEVNEADGVAFIAMEYVAGVTLRARVRECPSWQTVLGIGLEIAQGLARAHEQRIVHRDLKPENVVVTPQGHVKILDFGIAMPLGEAMASDGRGGHLRGIVGTPAYMSPEQAQGDAVDARSDVFSFGVLLYELLTGELPFQREESRHPQLWGNRESPEWRLVAKLRAKRPDVPEAIEAIVNRALSLDASDRFADGAELVTALEAAMTLSMRAEEPRSPAAVIIALAAVVAVIAMGGAFIAYRRPPPPPPAAVVMSDAVKAMRNGIQEMRDANDDAARSDFEKAAELDPNLGAAHLRRAALAYFPNAPARAYFEKATRLRASLDGHDRAMLEAVEPWMRDPSDIPESVRRFDSAAAADPNDIEIGLFSCRMHFFHGQQSETIRACDRVLSVDASVAKAWQLKGAAYADKDDIDAARAAYNECLNRSASAMVCLSNLFRLDAGAGHCAEALDVSRKMVAATPSLADGHRWLAVALYASGQPVETSRIALSRAWERDGPEQALNKLSEQPNLDILGGDFDAARSDFDVWSKASATATSDEWGSELFAAEAALELETGRNREADALASEFVRRSAAWTSTSSAPSPMYPLAVRYLSGAISRAEFRIQRDQWIAAEAHNASRAGRLRAPGVTWINAYALPTKTTQDAREALEALPRFLPLPAGFLRLPLSEEATGRVYLLAGDRELATFHLRRAADSCWALQFPIAHTVANLELGEALEKGGDPIGACAAYRRVTARWGRAPGSISAARARVRIAATCPSAD